MMESGKVYPGDVASPDQIRMLADEYSVAARTLLSHGRRRQPLSWAPSRLAAIHAVELYLNAFLMKNGLNAAQIRGLQHDLAKRTELSVANGLRLRIRTVAHLKAISASREYLVYRYAPELVGSGSQLNRLMATLDETAKKVGDALSEASRAANGNEGKR